MGKRKIDESKLIMLATHRDASGKGLTQSEIAEQLGVTTAAVSVALKKLPKSVLAATDANSWRTNRADVFADMQRFILQYITPDKLKHASINQLGTLFGIMYDKEAKERGHGTPQSVSLVQINQIDPKAMKHIKDAIAAMTQKALSDAKGEYIPDAEIIEQDTSSNEET